MRILTLFIQHRAYQFVEFVLKFSGNASSAAARHSAGTLSKVLRSKMGDFLYSLDKFRLDKKSVSKMLDDTRTGMLTQVGHEKTCCHNCVWCVRGWSSFMWQFTHALCFMNIRLPKYTMLLIWSIRIRRTMLMFSYKAWRSYGVVQTRRRSSTCQISNQKIESSKDPSIFPSLSCLSESRH